MITVRIPNDKFKGPLSHITVTLIAMLTPSNSSKQCYEYVEYIFLPDGWPVVKQYIERLLGENSYTVVTDRSVAVGDKVRIIGNRARHNFQIGEIVTIVLVPGNGYDDSYKAINDNADWWISATDFESVVEGQ